MSDTMLFGVLRMPYEMAMSDEMSRLQFYGRVQEVLDRMVAAEARASDTPRVAGCHCAACDPYKPDGSNMRMIVCSICGNKRCPHANDHRNTCTNSNALGQKGSSWEHVTPVAALAEAPAVPVGYASPAALSNMRQGVQESATLVTKDEAEGDDIPLYAAPPQAPQPTDLHAAIMNLPTPPEVEDWPDEKRIGYKAGHKDARHAAAELVAASQPEPVWCGCGDAIMPDDGAQCGTCAYVETLAPQSSPWQPIATAPRDARILAVVEDGDVRVVRWGKASHVPMYGFCLADQGAEDFDICEPTHWAPLPAPPCRWMNFE